MEELEEVAGSHGWSLESITVRELVPSESSLQPEEQYTMFHPADVELSWTAPRVEARSTLSRYRARVYRP
jgi:circadian clock protein KaiC